MNTIFMNSRNSQTSDSDRLLLNLLDQKNKMRSNKYAGLCLYYT